MRKTHFRTISPSNLVPRSDRFAGASLRAGYLRSPARCCLDWWRRILGTKLVEHGSRWILSSEFLRSRTHRDIRSLRALVSHQRGGFPLSDTVLDLPNYQSSWLGTVNSCTCPRLRPIHPCKDDRVARERKKREDNHLINAIEKKIKQMPLNPTATRKNKKMLMMKGIDEDCMAQVDDRRTTSYARLKKTLLRRRIGDYMRKERKGK